MIPDKYENKMQLLVLFSMLVFGFSCCCSGDPGSSAGPASVVINNRDSNLSVFLGQTGFPKDSLKIFNELKEPQSFYFRESSTSDEIILSDVYNPQLDASSINRETCKTYILQFLYKNSDTLKICYQTEMTKCEGTVFSYLKAYFNSDQVYSEGKGYHEIIIQK